MSNLPEWVKRDLRRQELEARLRAAADAIPAHSYHAAPAGEYCVGCGLPQVHPIHDIRDVSDAWTASEMAPTDIPVNELETSGEFDGTMMIALWPDPEQAKRLAISGGEKAKNLHITLAFFPTAEGADKLRAALADIAPYMSPLKGEISGIGMFTSSHREGAVTYASADLPGLPEFRQIVVDTARAVGVAPADNHGFTPHMTLAYGDRRDHTPPNEPLSFDEMVLSVGGKEKYTFKLGSPETAKEGKQPGKHMYSHPNFLRGSGLPDKESPSCMVCGQKATDPVHEKPEHAAVTTSTDAAKTMQGIDAGIDQALVLLRSCREDQMPEYALQARDLLQAIDEACDNMLAYFGVADADEGPADVQQEQADGPLSTGPVESALPVVTPAGPQGQPTGTLIQPVLGQPDGTLTQKVLGQPQPSGPQRVLVSELARYYSPDERAQMARTGEALPDGSYPIRDGADLHAAIALVGHGGETAKAHIIKRAHDLGLERELPVDWTGPTQKAFISEINGRTLLTGRADTFTSHWEKAATPNKHILWVQGRFVGGEVPNRNKALWSSGDLEMGQPTVAYGPLNWLHEARHVVGCIADSRLVLPDGKQVAELNDVSYQPHIAALAGVWTWIYPDESWVIENASDQGKLWYSMECISENVECTGDGGCGEKASYGDYMAGKCCAHMRERSGVRRFENPTFLGGAVIVPPVRPGWADADVRVVREAAAIAEKAYDQAGRPDVSANDWEMICGQVVQYALD